MIPIPEVLTAGGTSVIRFELYDDEGERAADIPAGVPRVSIRKKSTSRTEHELPLLNASLDRFSAVVTLELSGRDTGLIGPDEEKEAEANSLCVTDVRIISADAITYYGPYEFRVRLPETFTWPGTGPQVTRLDITAIDETTATATLTIEGHDGSTVYLRWKTLTEDRFGPALSKVTASDTVEFDITGLEAGTTYQVRASFDDAFGEGVEAARFDTLLLVPPERYTYVTTPYTAYNVEVPFPTEAEILLDGNESSEQYEIFFNNPGVSGYPWIFSPVALSHVSVNSVSGANQLGGFPFRGMITINEFEYFAYQNTAGLASFAFDLRWFAY